MNRNSKIRIIIRRELFNDEYHADIVLSHNDIQYLASDDLETLLDEIKLTILENEDKSA